MRLPFDLILLDLETNGSKDHRIVEIGAVRLDQDLKMMDTFQTLVDGRPVTQEVVEIHGITEAMLEGQPKFKDVHESFDEWCKLSPLYVLAAFGAYFDMPVLRAEYDRIGLKFPHRGDAVDVKGVVWIELLKRGLPVKYLDPARAAELLGIPWEGTRHRGLDDAKMEAKIFRAAVGARS